VTFKLVTATLRRVPSLNHKAFSSDTRNSSHGEIHCRYGQQRPPHLPVLNSNPFARSNICDILRQLGACNSCCCRPSKCLCTLSAISYSLHFHTSPTPLQHATAALCEMQNGDNFYLFCKVCLRNFHTGFHICPKLNFP
jgi:hypothetical protein